MLQNHGPNETSPFEGTLSVGGKSWIMRSGDPRLSLSLQQKFSVDPAAADVMAARQIGLNQAEKYLNPRLQSDLPDPSSLKDMDKAAQYLADIIIAEKCVGIFGDYDVDGATSSAMLIRFFRALGPRVFSKIPDRISEGYGPNLPALLEMKEEGADVIITVDCGITAFDVLDKAQKAGIDVIVVDHHVAEFQLPKAVAVVNPNRLDDESAQGQMAAVGVCFLLVIAVNRILRSRGFYQKGKYKEPDIRQWLDLVALGTICDVVPLSGVNRALVSQGLKVMAMRTNPGLVELARIARASGPPDTYHAGFLLGPRINAGGRVGKPALGTEILSATDPAHISLLAEQLDIYNTQRQEIEAICLEQAIEQIENENHHNKCLIFVTGKLWHPGVIGIVASRLKERYGRPACVIAIDEEGIAKGSGRSVEGIDLGAAIIAARQQGLLLNGGGHKMAAGFTLETTHITALQNFLSLRIEEQTGGERIVPVLKIDGVVSTRGISLALIDALEKMQPFGAGNPEPRFMIRDARITQASVVGGDHVRFGLTDLNGGRLNAIAFRCADTRTGSFLLKAKGGPLVHLAGRLHRNSWQGYDSPQLIMDDIMSSS